jgi:hypothetical protein
LNFRAFFAVEHAAANSNAKEGSTPSVGPALAVSLTFGGRIRKPFFFSQEVMAQP